MFVKEMLDLKGDLVSPPSIVFNFALNFVAASLTGKLKLEVSCNGRGVTLAVTSPPRG